MRYKNNSKRVSQLRFSVIILLLLNLIVLNSYIFENTNKSLKRNDNTVLLETNSIDYCGYRKLLQSNTGGPTLQAETTHPLGGETTLALKLEELAIIQNNGTGWILEDDLHNFNTNKTITKSGNITTAIQAITTGQFDNDTEEELLISDLDGNVVIYDDAKHGYVQKYYYKFPAAYCYGQCDGTIIRENDVATGDFDGDGLDEFCIVLTEWDYDDTPFEWIECNNYDSDVYFYIYDIQENVTRFSWSFLLWDQCGSAGMDHITQPRLKTGEFDGDGKDEIVLTTGGPKFYRGWIFDENNGTYRECSEFQWNNYQDFNDPRYFNSLALGDIDGDHLDEILYIIKESGEQGESIRIKDDEIQGYRELAVININEGSFLESGDIDGDGFDEIITFSRVLGNTFGIVYDDIHTNFTVLKTWQPADLANIIGKKLTVGDVDADGMAEIIFSTGNNLVDYYESGLVIGNATTILDDAKHNYTVLLSDSTHHGFITTGDFDADGVKLKYIGKHWTTTAPPKIVMVIAAPPTYKGISQNYIYSYTAFGKEVSTGEATGNSIGISEGNHWSVGVKAGIKIKLFEVEASFTFRKSLTQEFLRTNTKTRTETTALGYLVGISDDAVIFHRTVFDNYKYEIISHPTNPDAIGEFMTIDVPQTPRLFKTTIPYYNKKYSSIAPTIGSETFNHTVGEPWTYPTISTIESIAPIRWASSEMQTVGLGDAASTTSIKIETTETLEMKRTYTTESSYDFEGSMGIGGKYGGIYATAGGGWSSASIDVRTSSVTVGESCIYEGSVGDIKKEVTWEQLDFDFCIIVYNIERSDEGIRYQVVNYIVDNISEEDHPFYHVKEFVGKFSTISTEWLISSIVIAVGVSPAIYFLIKRIKKR
ncbi:MAG: FG-GAP repeat domain-containing protein [Promethearchaeota archaeon]